MTQANDYGVSFLLLLAGTQAASLAAAGQYQCLDPSGQLHSLLNKYALKCANPACPLCYPARSQP